MGVIAGFLVQNTLKYLLKFGKVSNYLGYSALTDFFPTMNLKPNPHCDDSNCCKRQREFALKPKTQIVESVVVDDKPLHEDNQWGISLVDESVEDERERQDVASGINFAYSIPVRESGDGEVSRSEETSLEELMAQMKSI